MEQANKGIREAIDTAKLSYWQVAGEMGIHATTLTVWLRTPLNDTKEAQVRKAIDELATKTTQA